MNNINKYLTLVYVREYFKEIYLPIFTSVKDIDAIYLTDFPTTGMKNIRDMFYLEIQKLNPGEEPGFDVDDVIKRCRLLRNIDSSLARLMAIAMYRVMIVAVEESQCKVIVGQLVDDYITHVLSLVAASRGIEYIGICSSYFPGYTQISKFSSGEPVKRRAVGEEEAHTVLDKIIGREFKMDYSNPKKYTLHYHVKQVFRFYIKIAIFALLKHYKRDALNYHYTVQRYLSQPKRILNYPLMKSFNQDWIEHLNKSNLKKIYLPLAVVPEASTDYWVPHTKFIEYESAVLDIASNLGDSYQVIVKEHSHMLGIRNRNFYEQLKKINNVVSVPPDVVSNWLLEEIRPSVLVGAGSVGIEATLRGLPVVTYSPSSYWFKPSGSIYVNEITNIGITKALSRAKPLMVEPVQFIRECLESMVHFDFMNAHSLDSSILSRVAPFFRTN